LTTKEENFGGGKMRRKAFLSVWLMMVGIVSFYGPGWSFQNEPNGFRGIAWGTVLSTIPGFYETNPPDEEGYSTYQRKNENMTFGTAMITYLDYAAMNGEFCDVTIFFTVDANFKAIKKNLFAKYGERPNSFKKYPDSPIYVWNGTITRVLLSWVGDKKEGTLQFFWKKWDLWGNSP